MGAVYLAATGKPGTEKLCVVKRLIPGTVSDPDRVARFRREANIVRTLSHGAIAQSIAVDDVDGEPFIVQEFIQGRTIVQLLSSAQSVQLPLPPTLAIYIAREVARALAYAHRKGIVHRDVAPPNVMVTFTGEVRLIDFGVARGQADAALTGPGFIVGRNLYTAPEVLAGATADAQTDVYAVGMLLWELLTGRPPITPEGQELPPPSSLSKLPLPAGADTVFLQATDLSLGRRFPSAEELQRGLGALLAPNFVGEGALAAFIGRCYDVEREQRLLDQDVLEARPLLAGPPAAAPDAPAASQPRRRVLGVAALLAVAAGGVALGLHLRRPVATPPAVAPTAVAARVESPPAPPPTLAPPRPVPTQARSSPQPGAASVQVAASTHRPSRAAIGVVLDRASDSIRAHDLGAAEHDIRAVLDQGTAVQRSRAHTLLARIDTLRQWPPKAIEDELNIALQLDPNNVAAAADLAALRHRSSQ
jgi:serine/threonine-protein kinase